MRKRTQREQPEQAQVPSSVQPVPPVPSEQPVQPVQPEVPNPEPPPRTKQELEMTEEEILEFLRQQEQPSPTQPQQYPQPQYIEEEQHYEPQPQQPYPYPPKPRTPHEAYLRKLAEEEHEKKDESPLSIYDEIKAKPIPKGHLPVMIGGRPLDLHALEDYVVKISPFSLKTVLRYHNARTIEEIKGYSKGTNIKLNAGMIIFIIFAIGLAIVGIIIVFYLPELMAMFGA